MKTSRLDFIGIIFNNAKGENIGAIRLSNGMGTIEVLEFLASIRTRLIGNPIRNINHFNDYCGVISCMYNNKKYIEKIMNSSKANVYITVKGEKIVRSMQMYIQNIFWEIEKEEEKEYSIGRLKNSYNFEDDNSINDIDLYKLIGELKELDDNGKNVFKPKGIKYAWGLM